MLALASTEVLGWLKGVTHCLDSFESLGFNVAFNFIFKSSAKLLLHFEFLNWFCTLIDRGAKATEVTGIPDRQHKRFLPCTYARRGQSWFKHLWAWLIFWLRAIHWVLLILWHAWGPWTWAILCYSNIRHRQYLHQATHLGLYLDSSVALIIIGKVSKGSDSLLRAPYTGDQPCSNDFVF